MFAHHAFGRQLWLVRHGNRLDFVQPAWFTTAQYPYDPPLCSVGDRQAKELGDRLANEKIDHIFSSPFFRTLQTAHYYAQRSRLQIKLEPGLGEWHNPAWMRRSPQCHSPDFLRQHFSQINWYYQARIIPCYPESSACLTQRSIATLQGLLCQFSGNLLLLGHKIPLGICLGHLLGKAPSMDLDVCAINQLIWLGDRWIWHQQNDTSFLSTPGIRVATQ